MQLIPEFVIYDNIDTCVMINVLDCAVNVLDCEVNSLVRSI